MQGRGILRRSVGAGVRLVPLLLTSYAIPGVGGDLAAATRSDHSRAANRAGKNLNLTAKAVKKNPLFRDGVFKKC